MGCKMWMAYGVCLKPQTKARQNSIGTQNENAHGVAFAALVCFWVMFRVFNMESKVQVNLHQTEVSTARTALQ